MSNSSSTAAEKTSNRAKIIKILAIVAISSCIILYFLNFERFQTDPYIARTLNLEGSLNKGEKIFKVNCVGCHGVSAQGLLGPDLHQVSKRLEDKKIINQIVKGRTPPMPRFQIDSQGMADLLSYLHSLNN